MRFGHWKDTGIRLEGEAVWSLTSMFLSTFYAYHKEYHGEDIEQFKNQNYKVKMKMIINNKKSKNRTLSVIVFSRKVYLHDFLHHVVSLMMANKT